MDNKGFVYIMTNDSMPGLVKVGMSKKVPTERAKELEDTGVPKPYEVQYYAFFDNMHLAEKEAHKALTKYHYNKEFFEVDVGTAIYHVENIGIPFKRLHSKPDDDRHVHEFRRQIQEEDKTCKEKEQEGKLRGEIEEPYKRRFKRIRFGIACTFIAMVCFLGVWAYLIYGTESGKLSIVSGAFPVLVIGEIIALVFFFKFERALSGSRKELANLELHRCSLKQLEALKEEERRRMIAESASK